AQQFFARLVKRIEAPSSAGLIGQLAPPGSTALGPSDLKTQIAIMRNAVAGKGFGHTIPTAKKSISMGVILVLVTFFGLGSWAAIAPIGSAAIATGTIATASGKQSIQHLEEGIVE